jgi:hypothetical protein
LTKKTSKIKLKIIKKLEKVEQNKKSATIIGGKA